MKLLSRTSILTIFLVFVFLGSAFFVSPRLINSTASAGNNAASSQVNPVSPLILKGYSQVGGVPPSFPELVTIAVPLNNLALAQSMEAAISNPHSPQYRHFLSQQTIQQLFLPVAKYQSTLNYLTSNGFTITNTAEDSIIVASTTAGQLKSVLGLSTELYSNGTRTYYSAFGSPVLSGVYVYASNATMLLVQHPSIVIKPDTFSSSSSTSQSVPNVTSPFEGYQASQYLSAYNANSLIASGANGKGKTIGILEFGGTPFMAQELQVYDQQTGTPAPPSFKIVPIGPYDPNLDTAGVEEELDVEFSHAMAPGAGLILYVGNDALNWAPIIATVDQQDAVNVFTQSWFQPEDIFPYFGPGLFDFNVVLGDQYFLLGSLEGISFLSASGDRGAVGGAGQPLGWAGWPSSSPYVTSVGGTQTYLDFQNGKVVSTKQTAWSNEGYEPTLANFGGGGGGVSSIEAKPWYQDAISQPASFPNGRMQPDLSLQAAVYPGTYVVVDSREVSSNAGYVTLITGGTSESSPLFAGLLCDVESSISGSLGLINPALYQIGQSSLYQKEFTPITFGYNGAWLDKSGYNLVNGWGAPNIGAWASYFATVTPGSTPSIQVSVTNSAGGSQFEFVAGQKIVVTATPVGGSSSKSSTYAASLDTLQGGIAHATLMYSASAKAWTGSFIVPASASGMTNVNVKGVVGGTTAFGFAQVFTGYLATIISPVASAFLGTATIPWSTLFGFNVSLVVTDLNGNLITKGAFSFSASSYSPSTNKYTPIVKDERLKQSMGVFNGLFAGSKYPLAPISITLNGGVFGFVSFQNGVSLVPSFILPPTNSQPGGVSPGQFLQIRGQLSAPVNTPPITSFETGLSLARTIELASTIIAYLVNPNGKVVSSVDVASSGQLTYYGFPTNFLGYLGVPTNAAPGLYSIWLKSYYQSIDLNNIFINGSYFGQVFVSNQPAIVPKITLTPNPVAEGQNLQITANIAYANGQEVKYGMYVATLYPAYDSNNYWVYSGLPAGQIPLSYDASLNRWVGNVVMPSPTSLGWIGGETYFDQGLAPGIVTQPVSGPWDAFVSGVSWDGVQTTTNEAAQQGFTVGASAAPLLLQQPSFASGMSLRYFSPASYSQAVQLSASYYIPILLTLSALAGILCSTITIGKFLSKMVVDKRGQQQLVAARGGGVATTHFSL